MSFFAFCLALNGNLQNKETQKKNLKFIIAFYVFCFILALYYASQEVNVVNPTVSLWHLFFVIMAPDLYVIFHNIKASKSNSIFSDTTYATVGGFKIDSDSSALVPEPVTIPDKIGYFNMLLKPHEKSTSKPSLLNDLRDAARRVVGRSTSTSE